MEDWRCVIAAALAAVSSSITHAFTLNINQPAKRTYAARIQLESRRSGNDDSASDSLTHLQSSIISRSTFLATAASASLFTTLPISPAFAENDGETTKVKFVLDNEGVESAVTATLHKSWSPIGYQHFLDTVSTSYYTNCPIFRVIPGFVAQFGLNPDPSITASNSKPIKDDPKNRSNSRLTLTYATAGPNTRTTQIFINLADNAFLDGQGFTPFGELDALPEIYGGYGEGAPRGKGPNQIDLKVKGEAAMANFPKMTRIKRIEVVE
eukprot:CAMPEP_0182460946 /NCGR_PEP_ID=MMETSP1319-20130603/5662_1 /TAXON_ID=172717 /ORGANISM="Bolidomonas pacifica, Strain RCC208" /LENGTH=266 /DNA_ID=CAMNT_0024660137 /DNA_START=6 /DNA_END=806 /DNA_ORIENTATION=+